MTWIDEIKPEYGTVTGQFVMVSHDSADEDLTPDVQPLNGTVLLTPTVNAGRIDDTVFAQIATVEARIFGGQIVDDEDTPGIRILSTDTNIVDADWAWRATFQIDSGIRLRPLDFKVEAGKTVHLTGQTLPIDHTPHQIIQGEQGASITGVDQVAPDVMRVVIEDPATGEQKSSTILLPEGPRGPEGPYGGTQVTDPQVASYVATKTETRAALNRSYAQGVTVTAYGAVGDGVADDLAAIQAAIDAAVASGVDVVLPAGLTFRTTGQLVANGPVRINGRGATLRAEGGTSALRISSSYVTVEGLTIVGNGSGAYKGAERGILSLGTSAAPFTGCHLRDVSVRAMGDTAIRVDWWEDSTITGGALTDLAYAGIIAQSCHRLRIEGVTVRGVWQHDKPQSYGISITDSENTVAGRSQDVTVNGCTVGEVAHWTAISTHGGERITFTNNRVIGCYRGIIYGAGNPTRVVTATDGLVSGNIVDGLGAGGSVGIGVIGQSTGAESTAFRSANLVKNHAIPHEASTNGYWMDDTQLFASDTGFPVAAAAVSSGEAVVDRITVPPATYDRRVSVSSAVYAVSSLAANRCDLIVYVGEKVAGRTRRALPGGSAPDSLVGVGTAVIPASTSATVVEVRVAVASGEGTMTTSAASNLTTTTVTVSRA